MAITQISRIQVRRGLQENLPQLSGGEFGWSQDQRKLYIGNGTIAEGAPVLGNTELLTEFSDIFSLSEVYTFKGLAAGYAVQTGPSLVAPVARPLQDKLDDIANFRDFGGMGDGVTNDLGAFNRAISQLYKASLQSNEFQTGEARIRRTLHIPAGIYILSGTALDDFIKLLPYVKLKGDGKNATIIIQRNAAALCAMMSADSKGQTGANVGNNAIRPDYMEVEDLTIINESPGHVVQLDSVTNITFRSVRMQGSQPPLVPLAPPQTLNYYSCLNLNSQLTNSGSHNLSFTDCDFVGNKYGIFATSKVTNVDIMGGSFTQLYRGIALGDGFDGTGTGNTPYAFKISHAVFDDIVQEAIVTSDQGTSPSAPGGITDGVANIVSAFNTFKDVGNNLTGHVPNNAVPSSNVINFGGYNSYSIGDTFDRAAGAAIPAVVLNGSASFATLPNGQMQLGKQVTVGGRSATLLAATTDIAGVVGVNNNATTVEYKIIRGADTRLGKLKIIPVGSTLAYDDEYLESSDTGVTLLPVLNAGIIELQYTATAGSNATLTTTSRTLI